MNFPSLSLGMSENLNLVIKCLSEMFNTRIPLNVKLSVLGIYPKDFIQTSKQTKLLDFGLLQARRAIALCWKSMDAPSLKIWIKELLSSIGPERLTYITKGKGKTLLSFGNHI